MNTAMCECGNATFEHRPKGQHVGEYCTDCGKWARWVRQSDNAKRRNGSTNLARGDYCKCCLRHIDELGDVEHLVGHHVIPVHAGGSDDAANVWTVCNRCHDVIEMERRHARAERYKTELVPRLRQRGDQRIADQNGRQQESGR